jgi:hypothetical protein
MQHSTEEHYCTIWPPALALYNVGVNHKIRMIICYSLIRRLSKVRSSKSKFKRRQMAGIRIQNVTKT